MNTVHVRYKILLSAFAVVMLTACASTSTVPEGKSLAAEVLLRAEPLTGSADLPEVEDVDVLALDPAMLAFLDENVNREHGRALKLYELVYAIITDGSFNLEYDGITRTAQETFESRLGNCLSFTNMFVAMAREVGITVDFQEIEVPPSWALIGDNYVLSRHMNVVVDLGVSRSRVIDFNIDDFRSSYDRQLVSDARALAHYYSNVGIEHLQHGATLEALRYFRKAIAVDDEFASAWSNLGALYSKAGHFDYAEAAYLQALKINPHELVAMSNLGQLYEYREQPELAEWYNEQTQRHRMRNPYYRYHLAHKAFVAGDYETAIEHLKYSVKKNKNEDSFYALMGLSYLQEGDEAKARRWLERAERIAEEDSLKRSYHNKIDMLGDAG